LAEKETKRKVYINMEKNLYMEYTYRKNVWKKGVERKEREGKGKEKEKRS